jgi:ubiquinone/menaquinone biosynthesis C-methylase UbiE
VKPEERRYYDLRAPSYDDWWTGAGAFEDRDRAGWAEETERLESFLAALPPRRTLDVACGTGFLTRHLPGAVTALDQSPTMLDLARRRVPGAELVLGDALSLPFPDEGFDLVFTAHFYGHLDESDRGRFLAEARRVAANVLVVDSATRQDAADGPQARELPDGSVHRVFKRFFTADALAREIGGEPVFEGRWFVAAEA